MENTQANEGEALQRSDLILPVPARKGFQRHARLLAFTAAAIFFGALNNNLNLLFLFSGMVASLFVASEILSRVSLAKVNVSCRLPEDAVAGESFVIQFQVESGKRLFASHAVNLILMDGKYICAQILIPYLPPREAMTVIARGVMRKRGEHAFNRILVRTSFPFHFAIRQRTQRINERILVLPLTRALTLAPTGSMGFHGQESGRRPGGGSEFHSLREHHYGDDARRIVWRVSARRNELICRENSQPSVRRAIIVFQNDEPPPNGLGDVERYERFEEGVILAASAVSTLLREGFQFALQTASETTSFRQGSVHLLSILRLLARVQSVENGAMRRAATPVQDPGCHVYNISPWRGLSSTTATAVSKEVSA